MVVATRKVPLFRVGDRIFFYYGFRPVVATVVEDRGLLGRVGRRVYRIETAEENGEIDSFELEEQMLVGERPVPVNAPKAKPTAHHSPRRFSYGDEVTLDYPFDTASKAEVVEDRGVLGTGTRRHYRVRVTPGGRSEPFEIIFPEEELSVVWDET